VSPSRPLPSKDEILAFIRESPTPVDRRELARAFNLKGDDRRWLRAALRELQADGQLEQPERRKMASPGHLPAVAVIEISDLDEDGELHGRPARWEGEGPPPAIYIVPQMRSRHALALGDRALARLDRQEDGAYAARIIRRLGGAPRRVLGTYEVGERGGRLKPTDKRMKNDFVLRSADSKGAQPGELLLCEVKPHHGRLGHREVVVLERYGGFDDERALSLIAIHEHGIPTEFPDAAVEEAEAAGPVGVDGRTDLRGVPLVTIDGADARDFDDAVFAEADPDAANPGGWHLLVAIADVAWYVRSDSALDRAARQRGNSVYFPDRVVPMLPEGLSNGWCSLKPREERGCLVAELWIDAGGRLKRHRFLRGLMRSAARLTYEQVQAARDGRPDDETGPLMDSVIAPLYGAFASLAKAREERGTLDLDLTERRVVFGEDGRVAGVVPRSRLDSHRLIEEFMITANVAAATELERLRQPCMYRVHEEPDAAKVEALREVLDSFDLRLAKGQVIRPKVFTRILEQVAGRPESQMVSELVLRTQAQAIYSPDNVGHFGLALGRYAHFTSPIRRYADLLVHRAMISGLHLGDGGLADADRVRFEELGQHLSQTERRAAAAERDAVDRMTAALLKGQVGRAFTARISSVLRFGLFVSLDDVGADGLVPVSTLPQDYYVHDEKTHSLIGRRWGRRYRLGERVRVVLKEADPITGGLLFELSDTEGGDDRGGDVPAEASGPRRRAKGAPRPAKRRRR